MRDEFKAARRLYTVRVSAAVTVEPPDYDPDHPNLHPAQRLLLQGTQLVSEEIIEHAAIGHVKGQVIGMLMERMAAATEDAAEVERRLK